MVTAGLEPQTFYLALVGLVTLARIVELLISQRNTRRLLRRGAFEVGAGHYPWMVLLHVAFLVACPFEVMFFERPWIPSLAIPMSVLLVLTMALRFWVIAALGERWTTRVFILPGAPPVQTGPYRWGRHPNYLAVALELIALPLIHTAWVTAALFAVLNGLLLAVRIRVEDEALIESEILAATQELAREHLHWNGTLRREMRLVEDLGLDSLKLLTLTIEIENHFHICLDEEAEAEIITVGDLARVIRRMSGP
jgi:methyltransferase